MKSRTRHWLAILLALALLSQLRVSALGPEAASSATIQVSGDRVTLGWIGGRPALTTNADGSIAVLLSGCETLNEPGKPRLPFASWLVTLPPDAQPELILNVSKRNSLAVAGPIEVAPALDYLSESPDQTVRSPGAGTAAATHDFASVTLTPIGTLRGVRLAILRLYPVKQDGDTLNYALRATITLDMHSRLEADAAQQDAIVLFLQERVINPQHVIRSLPIAGEGSVAATLSPRAAIEVDKPGLTVITYADLAAAGFPITGTKNISITLRHGDQVVAYEWVEGNAPADTLFGSDDRVIFYADPRVSRWTRKDVYWLSIETAAGARMSTRTMGSALPLGNAQVTTTYEENNLYYPDRLFGGLPAGRDGDRWIWSELVRASQTPVSTTVQFNVANINPARSASLTLWFIGFTSNATANPDHRVRVTCNGAYLGQIEWDGKLAITEPLPIPAGVLRLGINNLTFSLPGITGVNVEGMWLDALQVQAAVTSQPSVPQLRFSGEAITRSYQITLTSVVDIRAYDITDSDQPQRLANLSINGNLITLTDPTDPANRRYALATESTLNKPAAVRLARTLNTGSGFAGADYIIIAPVQFSPALGELVSLRTSQGLLVATEDLQAIYDTYGEGRPLPEAIHQYLEAAYATWSHAPLYVLLVGDGTSDPKQYQSSSSVTFIPPYLEQVDRRGDETAADNRYVTFDDDGSSYYLPDLLIGRLPVNSLAEAYQVIRKIVAYESNPYPGYWVDKATFIADNRDSEGQYDLQSDILISYALPASENPSSIYYSGVPGTVTATRQSITQQWNAGAGLMVYTGHSAVVFWAAEGLLHLSQVPALTNGARLPVLLEMTCLTGSFQVPSMATLDESLLRSPGGGIVAAWGPTGLGMSDGHTLLAYGFMKSIYGDTHSELGWAALLGKIELVQRTMDENLDLVDTYTLLGDPATRYAASPVLWPNQIYVPLTVR